MIQDLIEFQFRNCFAFDTEPRSRHARLLFQDTLRGAFDQSCGQNAHFISVQPIDNADRVTRFIGCNSADIRVREFCRGDLQSRDSTRRVRNNVLYATFKRAHPWIAELDVLPFNQLFVAGERSKSFAGGGTERLVNRLRQLVPATSA